MRRGAHTGDTGDLGSGLSVDPGSPIAAAVVCSDMPRRRESAAAPGSTTDTA